MRRESRRKDTRMEEGPPGSKSWKKRWFARKAMKKRESAAFSFPTKKGDQKQSVEKKKFFVFPVAKSPFLAFYFTKRENINRKKEEGKW